MVEEQEPRDFATLAGFLLDNPDWPWPEELQIIAEGIELPEQLTMLRELGCEFGQGFLYAPALPEGKARRFIEHWCANSFAAAAG